MTAKLTFYGGVDEIGGNKILLQTDDGSVLLDFSRRMGEYGKFFSEFLVARSKRHVSGHASKPELKELIKRINPAKIIPIPTTNTEKFDEMFGTKVVFPKYAQPIDI